MLIDGINDATCKEISFHPEENALFFLPGYDPTKNPSCRMHACDQGIFKKLLQMIIDHVKAQGQVVIREFENRFVINAGQYIPSHYSYVADGACYSSFLIIGFFQLEC